MSIISLPLSRFEVMKHVGQYVEKMLDRFLRPVELNWQPADLLPDASSPAFFEQVKELQERAKSLAYDFWAVLIGDMITEEALPTYESWIMSAEGIDQMDADNPWVRWTRAWTAEENRHGDLLNKYLYLSGRVDMKQVEASTQYLIREGFNIGTGNDPYRNFIYTSFQELATYTSHQRVAELALQHDNPHLAEMCQTIAQDEYRHAYAYMAFIERVIEADPNEALVAFEDMMRKKIVMPAHYLREMGVKIGETFKHFSDAAQRLGVYTAEDYVQILDILLEKWKIEHLTGLNEKGEKARDYLLTLPDRLIRIASRLKIDQLEYRFKWIR
jgi:acyl-[acyl-carrier-protein] desaturase